MQKPSQIETTDAFFAMLEKGPISGVLLLGGPLRSSHEFHLEKGRVVDESMVDGSTTRFTRTQFKKSFFAEAIRAGRLWAE